MPYTPATQKSVLISRSAHALLLKIMEAEKRGQQQSLDFMIEEKAKLLGLMQDA